MDGWCAWGDLCCVANSHDIHTGYKCSMELPVSGIRKCLPGRSAQGPGVSELIGLTPLPPGGLLSLNAVSQRGKSLSGGPTLNTTVRKSGTSEIGSRDELQTATRVILPFPLGHYVSIGKDNFESAKPQLSRRLFRPAGLAYLTNCPPQETSSPFACQSPSTSYTLLDSHPTGIGV